MMQNMHSLLASLDPYHRQKQQELQLKSQIEGAKLNLKERHHQDMMSVYENKNRIEREKAELDAQANIEKEKISGLNALSIARQGHTHALIEQDNAQVHALENQIRESYRDQHNKILDGHNSLISTRADAIRQRMLSEQQHLQEMEKMRLASSLAMQEKQQEFLHQDYFARLQNNHEYEKMQEASRLATLEKEQEFLYQDYFDNSKHQREIQNREQEFLHKESLQNLSHQQAQEQKILDANLERMAVHLKFLNDNYQVSYAMINDIVRQLLERFLNLGAYQASDEDMSEWVREAMDAYSKMK